MLWLSAPALLPCTHAKNISQILEESTATVLCATSMALVLDHVKSEEEEQSRVEESKQWTHPVLQVLSEEIASCSLVQSRCLRLSLAAAVLSRRKFASPIPLDFKAAEPIPTHKLQATGRQKRMKITKLYPADVQYMLTERLACDCTSHVLEFRR